jgi:hypothetical protein
MRCVPASTAGRQGLAAEGGASVVEELISVTVVAVVALTALLGLSTLSIGSAGQRDRVSAETLLVAQAEAIKAAAYANSYTPSSVPASWSVVIDGPTSLGVPGVQQITISVAQGGRTLRSITLLKGDR